MNAQTLFIRTEHRCLLGRKELYNSAGNIVISMQAGITAGIKPYSQSPELTAMGPELSCHAIRGCSSQLQESPQSLALPRMALRSSRSLEARPSTTRSSRLLMMTERALHQPQRSGLPTGRRWMWWQQPASGGLASCGRRASAPATSSLTSARLQVTLSAILPAQNQAIQPCIVRCANHQVRRTPCQG